MLTSAVLLLFLRPMGQTVGLVDRPGGHKRHKGEIPVVGGIAIYSGLILAAFSGAYAGLNSLILLGTAAVLVVLGAIDDRFSLPVIVRLVAHLGAAFALIYGTGLSVQSFGDFFGTGPLLLGFFSLPFTIVGCIALINAFNMLDGMDGLAGGTSLVAFTAFAALAWMNGSTPVMLVSASMIGALLAFLFFNMPAKFNRPWRTFMGDAGSTLLGFLLAGVALGLVQSDGPAVPPVLILWMMPIPIFELFASTFRRLLKGKSPFAADRGHFHHVLLDAGFSVRAIFYCYLLFSILSASLGVLASRHAIPDGWWVLGLAALAMLWRMLLKFAPRIASRLPQQWHRENQSWV